MLGLGREAPSCQNSKLGRIRGAREKKRGENSRLVTQQPLPLAVDRVIQRQVCVNGAGGVVRVEARDARVALPVTVGGAVCKRGLPVRNKVLHEKRRGRVEGGRDRCNSQPGISSSLIHLASPLTALHLPTPSGPGVFALGKTPGMAFCRETRAVGGLSQSKAQTAPLSAQSDAPRRSRRTGRRRSSRW